MKIELFYIHSFVYLFSFWCNVTTVSICTKTSVLFYEIYIINDISNANSLIWL